MEYYEHVIPLRGLRTKKNDERETQFALEFTQLKINSRHVLTSARSYSAVAVTFWYRYSRRGENAEGREDEGEGK